MTVWYAGAYVPAYQTFVLHHALPQYTMSLLLTYFLWADNTFYALLTVRASIIFVNKPTWCTNFSCMFISILYMFRAAMYPSWRELLYQCDTWFMSLCVDDRVVCRSLCSCIPDGCTASRFTPIYNVPPFNVLSLSRQYILCFVDRASQDNLCK